jgi:hypothetical protein
MRFDRSTVGGSCPAHTAASEPLAGLLGFAALPPLYLLAIAAIVAGYVASAELVKHWFYRNYGI